MKKSNRLSTKNSMANRARRRQTFIKSCKALQHARQNVFFLQQKSDA
ncbi:MAG: hypothetical protein IJ671_01385 [Succinivibrio sp.]|nr:hypothetical protein [Succinivibrio sp.]